MQTIANLDHEAVRNVEVGVEVRIHVTICGKEQNLMIVMCGTH